MQHDLTERSTRASLHDAPDILGVTATRPPRRAMLAVDFDEANKMLAASAWVTEAAAGAPFALNLVFTAVGARETRVSVTPSDGNSLEEDDPLRDDGQDQSRMAELVARDRLGLNHDDVVNALDSKPERHKSVSKEAYSLPAHPMSTPYRDPFKVKRAPGADTRVYRAGTTKAGVSEQRPSKSEGKEHHAAVDARQAVFAIDGPVGKPSASATENDEVDQSKPSSPNNPKLVRSAIVLLSLTGSRRFH